jgi:hypothetical protein
VQPGATLVQGAAAARPANNNSATPAGAASGICFIGALRAYCFFFAFSVTFLKKS